MTATPLYRRTFADAFVREPLALAASQPHQIAISSISVCLMAIFFGGSEVIPWGAAWAGAIGVEYAYLKGIGEAARTNSPWGKRLVFGTFALAVISGFLVLMGHGYQIEMVRHPSPQLAALFSLLEILTLSWIGLSSAMLHMEAERYHHDHAVASAARIQAAADEASAREMALEARRAEAALAFEQQQQQMHLSNQAARLAAEAEAERLRLTRLAEVEAFEAAQRAKLRLKAASVTGTSQERHSDTVTSVSQPRHTASQCSRDELYQAVVQAYRDDVTFNRTELAKRCGWSRTMINKMIEEARAKGEI